MEFWRTNADGTNSDMVDDSSHNNDSALSSHYETLQTEVTLATFDNSIVNTVVQEVNSLVEAAKALLMVADLQSPRIILIAARNIDQLIRVIRSARGNGIDSSVILQVDNDRFHCHTKAIAPNTRSNLAIVTIIMLVWWHPNLEDRSIVVNRLDPIGAYGLEVVNKIDPAKIVGPSKRLECFIWDPGPIINWLKRTKSLKEQLCKS